MQPTSTAGARRYLPLLVLVVLAGCGSSGSSQEAGDAGKRSVAGVEAAARKFVTNVGSGHYREACEGFTAEAQAALKREEPGGCLGSIAFLYGALGGQVSKFFENVAPKLEVQGDVASIRYCARVRGQPPSVRKCTTTVYARYEHGQWHVGTGIL